MNGTGYEASRRSPLRCVSAAPRRVLNLLCAGLLACLLWLSAEPADAELAVRVMDGAAIEGELGYFDVVFVVSSGTFDLSSYMIELSISGPTTGVQFTHFAEPRNPVFPGSIAESLPGHFSFPGTIAAPYDYLLAGSSPILDGTGLVRIWFETELGSAGVYDVIINPALPQTNFSNDLGELLPVAGFLPGSITVIPEPPTLTWDGGDAEWGDSNWLPGPASPAGAERMVVAGGHVTVENNYTDQFAASLLIEGGAVEVTPDGALRTLFETTVAGGTLAVDGTLVAGEVVVESGGVLSGTGTITATTVTIGGVLSPGGSNGSLGTLRVEGDLTFGGDPVFSGAGSATAGVPEPGTLVMVLMAMLALLLVHRRLA